MCIRTHSSNTNTVLTRRTRNSSHKISTRTKKKKRKKKIENLLISVWTNAGGLVVLGAIIVGAVIEGAVPLPHRSAPPLVHKVPVETREGSVLRTFALYEERTLIDAEFLQVSGMRIHSARHYFCRQAVFRRCLNAASPPPRRRLYMYFCGSQDARVAF